MPSSDTSRTWVYAFCLCALSIPNQPNPEYPKSTGLLTILHPNMEWILGFNVIDIEYNGPLSLYI